MVISYWLIVICMTVNIWISKYLSIRKIRGTIHVIRQFLLTPLSIFLKIKEKLLMARVSTCVARESC